MNSFKVPELAEKLVRWIKKYLKRGNVPVLENGLTSVTEVGISVPLQTTNGEKDIQSTESLVLTENASKTGAINCNICKSNCNAENDDKTKRVYLQYNSSENISGVADVPSTRFNQLNSKVRRRATLDFNCNLIQYYKQYIYMRQL